jgi:CRISPR-associated protein Csm3
MEATIQDKPQKPLLGKVRIFGDLVVETGLHIGGGGENLDIGGLDKPVIRNPLTREPYIPGSSLKGKLRAILERLLDKPLNRKGSRDTFRYESDDLLSGASENGGAFIRFEGARTCPISRLFGSTGTTCYVKTIEGSKENLIEDKAKKVLLEGVEYSEIKGRNCPARLIVRDSHLLPESASRLKTIDTGLYMTEWKFENGLDRITAAANPRQIERVPAGSKFQFEIVYTVEDLEQAKEDLKNLCMALAILEDDALGGHGSRGYGKVSFQNFEFSYRNMAQYQQAMADTKTEIVPPRKLNDMEELLSQFESVVENLLPAPQDKA